MNRQQPEPQTEPPYWTLDTPLFTGTFRYFDRAEYQTFLRSLGYVPVAKAAYGKPIHRNT